MLGSTRVIFRVGERKKKKSKRQPAQGWEGLLGPGLMATECWVCGMALGRMALTERQLHVNRCLDRQSREAARREEASAFSNSSSVPQDAKAGGSNALNSAHFRCVVCGRDLARLTVQKRAKHVTQCCSTHGVDVSTVADIITAGCPFSSLRSLVEGGAGGRRKAGRKRQRKKQLQTTLLARPSTPLGARLTPAEIRRRVLEIDQSVKALTSEREALVARLHSLDEKASVSEAAPVPVAKGPPGGAPITFRTPVRPKPSAAAPRVPSPFTPSLLAQRLATESPLAISAWKMSQSAVGGDPLVPFDFGKRRRIEEGKGQPGRGLEQDKGNVKIDTRDIGKDYDDKDVNDDDDDDSSSSSSSLAFLSQRREQQPKPARDKDQVAVSVRPDDENDDDYDDDSPIKSPAKAPPHTPLPVRSPVRPQQAVDQNPADQMARPAPKPRPKSGAAAGAPSPNTIDQMDNKQLRKRMTSFGMKTGSRVYMRKRLKEISASLLGVAVVQVAEGAPAGPANPPPPSGKREAKPTQAAGSSACGVPKKGKAEGAVPKKKKDKTAEIRKYILSDDDLYERIVMLDLVEVEHIQDQLKLNGVKVGKKTLISILDNEGVGLKTGSWN